jgi:hypothetical protein
MVGVPWGELAEKRPKASEALVTMLVLRLRDRAQAVDGTGGDGGRDLFEYTESNELVLYEAKSFTGRMDRGRRKQVVRSLVSASRHQPDHWDLLVPIDANPAEERWFDGLRSDFPFVRDWRGLRWLDQHFAAHPDLVRYALQESGDYILDRIAEARAERDTLLGGIPDLVERVRALNARAQEISPHYAVSASVDGDGQSTVRFVPKSPGPNAQSAISITSQFRFVSGDPDEEQRRIRLEETMRFGGDVELQAQNLGETTIEGPGGLGLNGTFVPDHMRITSPQENITPPLRAQLAVEQPSGVPVASLPVQFTQRTTGLDGGTLHGSDSAGFLHLRMRIDRRSRSCRMTLSFTPLEHALPGASVPVLRLIQQARAGHVLALVFAGNTEVCVRAPIPAGMTPAGWAPDEAQMWADAYDALATLQSRVGQYFSVPQDFTLRDAHDINDVLALLNGETVNLQGDTASVNVATAEALKLMMAAGVNGKIRFAARTESLVFTLGEHQINLGPCIEVVTVDRLVNISEARRSLAAHGNATVRMHIDKTIPALRYLGTELP